MPLEDSTVESTTDSIVPSTTPTPICAVNLPCGWGIYSKNRKSIEYFMRSTCICPSNTKCRIDGEDLSLGAYVYRCIAKETV